MRVVPVGGGGRRDACEGGGGGEGPERRSSRPGMCWGGKDREAAKVIVVERRVTRYSR